MTQETKPFSSTVADTLSQRVTVRFFHEKPIPEQMLQTILEAARRSPTSSNMQTYSIIVVRDQAVKQQLAVLAGNQKHIETCPVFIAFCADISRLEIACEMHGRSLAKTLETTLVATVDAALVGMSAETVAESFGLGAVMIGGIRNHPREAAELLGCPPGVYVVYGMCLGWPQEEKVPPQKPRMPNELIIHYESYSTADPRPLLAQYDEALAAHYGKQGRNLNRAAYTGVIANRLDKPSRPHLRNTLEEMGFRLV